MDDKKKFRLNQSKNFCMAPWVSINNQPNGDIKPCCLARTNSFGNLYQQTIEDIWNNGSYKQFRKAMLNDETLSTCEVCHKAEEWGSNSNYRKHWNELYSHKYNDLIKETNDDGSLNVMNLYRWDFRFNNLCNLACIGCGPDFSSSWIDLNKRMWPQSKEDKIYSSRENKEKFLETIKTQAQVVDNIYFAGGEPLLHPEHYEILNELDRLNKLDKVEFMYSTNLTNLHFKDQYVIDYWNKMKRCKVLVSLDEVDLDRLYYIRYPSSREVIIDNIKIINKSLHSVNKHWSIVPTWNILNTHRMKDIVEFFYTNELLPYSFYSSVSWEIDLHNIVLMYPKQLSISIATPEWKEVILAKLKEFEEWYNDVLIPLKSPNVRFFAQGIIKSNMEKFRKALEEENEHKGYKEWLLRLDKARETDFKKTFPELSWYYDMLF